MHAATLTLIFVIEQIFLCNLLMGKSLTLQDTMADFLPIFAQLKQWKKSKL
jgi:hypothetical protein